MTANAVERHGCLYLVPAPLDFGMPEAIETRVDRWLPVETIAVASRLTHWITENAKSTRALLKRIEAVAGLTCPIQQMSMVELPRAAHKKGDHSADAALDAQARRMLGPALLGHDVGLISEAGMPAIADPGSSVVRAAHALELQVLPLTGPVSLMLALAASGLNGQHFAFAGYVPQGTAERAARLKALEGLALKTGQTQILIETPYRNAALLQSLLQVLQPATRLAVACSLTLAQQVVRSGRVKEWKQQAWAAQLPVDHPTVFLFGP